MPLSVFNPSLCRLSTFQLSYGTVLVWLLCHIACQNFIQTGPRQCTGHPGLTVAVIQFLLYTVLYTVHSTCWFYYCPNVHVHH